MFGAQERLALRKFKFMKLVFSGWKNLVRRLHELHPCVFRKLVAWHAYTKRRIVHNRLMTSCFLPIFIWRRATRKAKVAREKARFLKDVLDTYIQLRLFRYMREYLGRRRFLKKQVLVQQNRMNDRRLHKTFNGWYIFHRKNVKTLQVFYKISKCQNSNWIQLFSNFKIDVFYRRSSN